MKKRTQSKQIFTISLGARLFLLVMLAGFLSTCGTVLQTPLPTATATELLTITLTPEPTATATAIEMPTITLTPEPIPTATEIPEKYPIDLEKLHNFPQSYEYLVAHPEEFVEAPNPLKDIDVFNDWFYNKFVPILGEWTEREANYNTSHVGMIEDYFQVTTYDNPGDLLGKPEFFYFLNNETLYPVITINIFNDNQESFLRTISMILYNGFGAVEGTGVIESLAMNKKIERITLPRIEKDTFPEVVNNLIKMGINANMPDQYDYNQVVLGIARIRTRE